MKAHINKANEKYWIHKCLFSGCPSAMEMFLHTFFLISHLPVTTCCFLSHSRFTGPLGWRGHFFHFAYHIQLNKKRYTSIVDRLIRHFPQRKQYWKFPISFCLNLELHGIEMLLSLSNSLGAPHYLIFIEIWYFGIALPCPSKMAP